MNGDIYNAAASILEGAVKKQGSLKHLCYSSKYKNKKKLMALVFQTVKYKKVLEKVVLELNDIWSGVESHGSDVNLKLVLLYETVLGRRVPIQCEFHDILHEHHDAIVKIFDKISQSHPNLVKESKTYIFPRYVRVNTIKCSMEEAKNVFIDDGYEFIGSKPTYELSSNEFYVDQHIPNLLVFYSDTDLHSHALYVDGKILLQDKASCLPAFVLNPPPRSFAFDACAAPGNKSSHLASIVGNDGTIYSFDMDKNRFDLMNKLLKKASATCVKTVLKDFLKVRHDSELYSKVEYILVDPSCSGSGIVSRMDELIDGEKNNATQTQRLKGLSGFQTAILSHALSFPNVKKVVYSTCSIHKEENEDVVEKACKRFASTFSLVDILPEWTNRGIGDWDEARKCIRAVPESDHTNGFFVALFERSNYENVVSANSEQKIENIVNEASIHREISTSSNKTNSKMNDVDISNGKTAPTKKSEVTKAVKRKKENDPINDEIVRSPFSVSSQGNKKKKGRGVKRPVTA